MFKNLLKKFSKKDKAPSFPIQDFSVIGTDMHSHLIPGIDDGSEDIETSIQMVIELKSLGFKKLITTPHVMCDYYKNSNETILSGLDNLKNELAKRNIEITIEAAAEYYLDEEFPGKIDNEKLLTFGDNYVLFETSYINKPENLRDVIFQLFAQKYKPIIAHPERYNYLYDDFKNYQTLKETGVFFQLNINSIIGSYSPIARTIAIDLIENNMVDFVGTDAHNLNHIYNLNACLKDKYCQKIITTASLLNNKL